MMVHNITLFFLIYFYEIGNDDKAVVRNRHNITQYTRTGTHAHCPAYE